MMHAKAMHLHTVPNVASSKAYARSHRLPQRQAAASCSKAPAITSRPTQAPAAQQRQAACMHRSTVRVMAMQSGWSPQQQPQPQPTPNRQAAPLARTPAYQPAPVFLELTQVLNKQVVTRTSGRSLGTISGAWLDPARGTLVSFDLDDRKQGAGAGLGLSSPARAGNIPLSALRQIGDVVLVHDESGLYEQDLDGRLGFVNPLGLDVRTRTGEFLGKVRDLSFSPDSGAVSRVTYDEFGLPFLPISFFDCYSVSLQDVLSIGRSDIIVYDDAKYRERKESAGLFAAIPSLLKSLNGPRASSPQLALPAPGSTSDMYRLGAGGSSSGAATAGGRYLPADYTYEQWQADLRRWEAETGMTYEQYLRSQGQQQLPQARNALPPASSMAQPAYQAPGGYAGPGYGQPQMQPGYSAPQAPQQQQQQQPQQQYGMPQQRPGQVAQPQMQQQQQQPQFDARQARPARYGAPRQQQPAGAAAGQPAAGPAWASGAAAAAGAAPAANTYTNPYANPRYANPAAAGQGVGSFGGSSAAAPGAVAGAGVPGQRMPQQPQQQSRPGQQQQQQPLRAAAAGAGSRPAAGMGRPAAAGRPGQQQQPSGLSGQAQQQPPQQQPTLQQQQTGRPVDDWLVRDNRPRMADALADGVLPLTEDGANDAGSSDQQQQQQRVQQQEVV